MKHPRPRGGPLSAGGAALLSILLATSTASAAISHPGHLGPSGGARPSAHSWWSPPGSSNSAPRAPVRKGGGSSSVVVCKGQGITVVAPVHGREVCYTNGRLPVSLRKELQRLFRDRIETLFMRR